MSFQDKVISMFASIESMVEALVARMELAIYKAIVSARVMATHETSWVKVPKPQGSRTWTTSYGIWSDTSRLSH